MLFENKSNNIAVIEDNGEIFTYNQLYKCGEMIISHIKERCLIIILCEINQKSLLYIQHQFAII